MRKRLFYSATGAFSLVEVTLALGIVSFVLVAILGLFSVGLEASRRSANDTIIPEIVNQLLVDIRVEDLPAPGESPLEFYYTEKGNVASKPKAIYTVSLTTLNPGSVSPDSGTHLCLIRLDITWPQGNTVIHASKVIP